MNLRPAALEKAESLERFAQHVGSGKTDFILALSRAEAYELLDYLASGGMGRCTDHNQLEADIQDAREAGDPFSILREWRLMGFELMPAAELH